jgi:hypothetical protein
MVVKECTEVEQFLWLLTKVAKSATFSGTIFKARQGQDRRYI